MCSSFHALQDKLMYFTFLKDSNLYLIGLRFTKPLLYFEYLKTVGKDGYFYNSLFIADNQELVSVYSGLQKK